MNFKKEHIRWMDGKMSQAEAADFSAHHKLDPLAPEEWLQSRALIMEASVVVPKHPDFLDARILQNIASTASVFPCNSTHPKLFKLSPLIWAGVGVLLAAVCLSFFVPGPYGIPSASKIMVLRPADSISVRFFKTPNSRSVAFSLDGIPAIPPDVSLR